MSWVKLDDKIHGHRKFRRAWKTRGALGLHMMALAYCSDHLTDGIVDEEFVEGLLPKVAERRKTVGALVDAGLWEITEAGWQIHDYLDYNPSRTAVEDKRAREAERKARGRESQRTHLSARTNGGLRPESTSRPPGIRAVSDGPVPTRPVGLEGQQ